MVKNPETPDLSRRDFLKFGLLTLTVPAFRPLSHEFGEGQYWEELSYKDKGRFGPEVDRVLTMQTIIRGYFAEYPVETPSRPSMTSYVQNIMGESIAPDTEKALAFIDYQKDMFQNWIGIREPVQCLGWAGLATSLLDVPTAKLAGKFGDNAIDLLSSDFAKKVAPGTFADTNKGYGVYRLSQSDPEWFKKIKKGDVFVIDGGRYGHVGVFLDELENEKGERYFLVTDANYGNSIGLPRTVVMSPENFMQEYGSIEKIGLLRSYNHERKSSKAKDACIVPPHNGEGGIREITTDRVFSPQEFDARYPENAKHMYASHSVLPDGTWLMNKPDEWLPLDPDALPPMGLDRNPISYMRLLEFFNIEKSPRFQPRYGSGKNATELEMTYCNVWSRTVAEAMGVPLPAFVNGVKMNANLYYRWFATEGAKILGWEVVDEKEAQELADKGYPTFIVAEVDHGKGIGHIAPIEPFGDASDPTVANVGRENCMHAKWSEIFTNHHKGMNYSIRYAINRGQGYRLTYFD